MYRIRTVCRNPACHAVFGVEFVETGPLEGKTPEIAFKISKGLPSKDPLTYNPVGIDNDIQIPAFIECPKCNSVFPRFELTFFVYNADATQTQH